jgi:hypothetical protein
MTIHYAEARLTGSSSITVDAIHVKTKRQLFEALRQHTKPIVIEDRTLARIFFFLLWLQGLWLVPDKVADIVKYAISQRYHANLKSDWHVGPYHIDNQIILTPTRPPRPPSQEE